MRVEPRSAPTPRNVATSRIALSCYKFVVEFSKREQ